MQLYRQIKVFAVSAASLAKPRLSLWLKSRRNGADTELTRNAVWKAGTYCSYPEYPPKLDLLLLNYVYSLEEM